MNNLWYSWSDVFNQSLMMMWGSFMQFVPKLIIAILLFIIGWIVASLVAKAFEQVIGVLKVDKLFASLGTHNLLGQAGLNLNTGRFVGQVVRWFIIIAFLLPSLSLLGLDFVALFLKDDVLGFLPKVFVAAFILIIATIVSDALSKFIVAGSKTMNIHSAHMLGTIAKYAVWVFALIIALGQLGIAETYMNTLFAGIIGMLALGGALAFGLGGKDAAARFIAKVGDEARRQ